MYQLEYENLPNLDAMFWNSIGASCMEKGRLGPMRRLVGRLAP